MIFRPGQQTCRLLTAFLLIALIVATNVTYTPNAYGDVATEEKFETVFTSAGYSAALGAGIGLALLAFSADPKEKLHYVTSGAAVGFLGGTVLGGYMVLVPDSGSPIDRIDPNKKATDTGAVLPRGLRLDWTVAQF